MKRILLIDASDTYIWCLQKYLQRRGYPVETASTLKEARTAIQEEMPLVLLLQQKIGKRRMEEGTGNGRGMML